jgi:uncharacterized protein
LEIRDPVHGNIDLNETEFKIIDTQQMQRLRYIKQLDMTYLVFPGANHTRFEHSLGTMQVTRELAAQTCRKEGKELSYVGLLHDIGHGPFSHLSEPFMKKNHEKIGEERIRNSEIKDIITDSELSFNRIMSYFKDADKIDIVGGTLGSDRIDYLMRDSHYTGVAYGVIDYERIKTRLILSKGRLAILESGVSGAESILIARYFMYSNVYAHHGKVIANKMLQRAIGQAIENKLFDADELANMYDYQLIEILTSSKIKQISGLTNRILERKLFKRAYYEHAKAGVDIKELEKTIMDAGFERSDFIVHLTGFGGAKDNIDVIDPDENVIGKLTEVSPLIKTLSRVLTDSRRLLVACDKKNLDSINKTVKRFLG